MTTDQPNTPKNQIDPFHKQENPIEKSNMNPFINSESTLESEYDDPSMSDYSDSYDSYYDDLPEVDQRNLYKPQKLAKYAETIYSIARDDILSIKLSSESILKLQTEIKPELREAAVKWIFNIHQEYKMSSDTLYEAVTYLNIVLSKSFVPFPQMSVITLTCIWMASKVEERKVPKLEDFCKLCTNDVTFDDFVKCERSLLTLLNFRLNYPTSKMFLRRLLDAIAAEPPINEVATFFCDLSLIPCEFVDFSVVVVAMAATCLGKLTLNKYCPTQRLMAYAHITDAEPVKKCCLLMLQYAKQVMSDHEHILYKKFTQPSLIGSIREMDLSPSLISKI